MADKEKAPPRRSEPPEPVRPKGCIRHSCGCLVMLLIFLACAMGVAWWQREAVFKPGGAWDQLVERVEKWRGQRGQAELDSLRKGVESVQQDVETFAETEQLRKRLDALRERIARQRDSASNRFRKEWDELADRSKTLFDATRDRSEQFRDQFMKLSRQVRALEKAQEGEPKPEE